MTSGKLIPSVLAAAAIAAATPGTAAAAAPPPAPVVFAAAGTAVAGQYVVLLKPGAGTASVRSTASALARRSGGAVVAEFTRAARGFTVRASADEVRRLARDARVAAIYQDVRMSVGAVQTIPAPPSSPWGLDRIDQRALPLNRRYGYLRGASNVHAYVIDTGIRTTHAEFGGRATAGFTAPGLPRPGEDCHGHGTHVAGTIGGRTYGVAKLVRLVGVKVFDCTGSATASQVIQGVEWVTANAVRPAVANMSLGGAYFPPLNAAVAASIDSGVSYAVAAGNYAADAGSFSPASTPAAITVGATGNAGNPYKPVSDTRAVFSNYGAAVDLFAPGTYIRSAWHLSDSSTNTISGTSMATPHVAGAAALYLGRYPAADPGTVRQGLVTRSPVRKVGNAGPGTSTRLLYAFI